MSRYEDKGVGFDVSHYQGVIPWDAIHLAQILLAIELEIYLGAGKK